MHAQRFSPEPRPLWPDAPHTIDPEAMHPRAVEMAQAMREGRVLFRDLVGAGFSPREIKRFAADAKSLATTLSTRQVQPGGDLLSEMIDKAAAAIANQPALPRGTTETQAQALAWALYCRAVAAHRIDPHPGQHERCLALLEKYLMRHTPAGPAIRLEVITAADKALDRRAGH